MGRPPFGWNVSSGKIYWSQETFRIFGYGSATEPTLERVLDRTHPEDRASIQEVIHRVSQEMKDFDVEHRLLIPDGSVKYVRVVARPSKEDESGNFEFVGAVTDITESKRAEQTLQKAQAELAHVTRVATLGELAGSIAHEISQPLGGITNYVHVGLRFLASGSENLEEVEAALSNILIGADRVNGIIVRMRALAKKVPPEMARLDFTDIVSDVLTLIHHELTRRRVEIELEISRELPPVLADRVQVQQVLLNLVMNGVEAMSEITGDRKIWIRADPYEHNGSSAVLVSVQDSGPGLKQVEVDRLFEAFYTTKSQGLGMGLAISRSIVEAHGGRLWLASAGGPGATFQFVLPAEGQV